VELGASGPIKSKPLLNFILKVASLPTFLFYFKVPKNVTASFQIGCFVRAYSALKRKTLPGKLIWIDPITSKCNVSFANGSMEANIPLAHVEIAAANITHKILENFLGEKNGKRGRNRNSSNIGGSPFPLASPIKDIKRGVVI
jgi:hypothetical protein